MMLALRLLHIVFGVLWVGAVVLVATFVIPSARAIGPAAGPMMGQLTQVRRLPQLMTMAGVLTVLSGLAMYWRVSSGFAASWITSGPGLTFTIGALAGLVSLAMGMTINAPLAKRMGLLQARLASAGGPPAPADLAALHAMQARLASLSLAGSALLLTATAAMAVARYIPA